MAAAVSPAKQMSPSSSSPSVSDVAGAGSDSLKAAIFQRLHPRVYLERFLAEKVRPDGRSIGCAMDGKGAKEEIWRDVSINVGSINTADGSALVRIGGTTIVCGVKAEIAEPDLENSDEGFLVPNVDLPAMCHPKFKPGPPADEAQVLSEHLFETLISSNFVSLKSLVIHPGKSVWTLYVDATCINYDGNVFDATLIAMVSALLNTRLPKAVYNEDTSQTTCYRESMSPLTLFGLPLPTSFGIFDSSQVLADPTAFEEPLLDGTISIVFGEADNQNTASSGTAASEDGQLLSVTQQGLGVAGDSKSGYGLGGDGILEACIKAGRKRRVDLAKAVREAIS